MTSIPTDTPNQSKEQQTDTTCARLCFVFIKWQPHATAWHWVTGVTSPLIQNFVVQHPADGGRGETGGGAGQQQHTAVHHLGHGGGQHQELWLPFLRRLCGGREEGGVRGSIKGGWASVVQHSVQIFCSSGRHPSLEHQKTSILCVCVCVCVCGRGGAVFTDT